MSKIVKLTETELKKRIKKMIISEEGSFNEENFKIYPNAETTVSQFSFGVDTPKGEVVIFVTAKKQWPSSFNDYDITHMQEDEMNMTEDEINYAKSLVEGAFRLQYPNIIKQCKTVKIDPDKFENSW